MINLFVIFFSGIVVVSVLVVIGFFMGMYFDFKYKYRMNGTKKDVIQEVNEILNTVNHE
jgi:fucose permease